MYCLKCRHVTETENIATATSRNGRLMRVVNGSHAAKLKLNSSKVMLPVEVFLILW